MLRQYGIVVSCSNSAPKSGIVLAHEPRRRHGVAGAAVLPSGQPRPRAGAGVAAAAARRRGHGQEFGLRAAAFAGIARGLRVDQERGRRRRRRGDGADSTDHGPGGAAGTGGCLSRRARHGLRGTGRRGGEVFEEGAPGRDEVAALLARLDQTTGRTRTMTPVATRRESKTGYRGRHWLTRPHPGVDRMSSAWLIRRFIDPQASFVFGDHGSAPDAIPFDTFEAEFGHHGSDCTFETLCQRFAIEDAAALHIGRIVHDLDLKESRYKEPEAETVGRLVEGLRRTHRDDDALLRAGMD